MKLLDGLQTSNRSTAIDDELADLELEVEEPRCARPATLDDELRALSADELATRALDPELAPALRSHYFRRLREWHGPELTRPELAAQAVRVRERQAEAKREAAWREASLSRAGRPVDRLFRSACRESHDSHNAIEALTKRLEEPTDEELELEDALSERFESARAMGDHPEALRLIRQMSAREDRIQEQPFQGARRVGSSAPYRTV